MTARTNCTCLQEAADHLQDNDDLANFREVIRSYAHASESDLIAERRLGISYDGSDVGEFLTMALGELEKATTLYRRRGQVSDVWEDELAQALTDLIGTTTLGLMALAGDL